MSASIKTVSWDPPQRTEQKEKVAALVKEKFGHEVKVLHIYAFSETSPIVAEVEDNGETFLFTKTGDNFTLTPSAMGRFIPSSYEMVDISGLDKAEVLKALYDAAKPLGMGALQFKPGDLSIEDARKAVEKDLYFDYYLGRPLKVNLSGDVVSMALYDRDQGDGAGAEAIRKLRASK